MVGLALGEGVDDVEHDADVYAAVAERLPVPSPGPGYARAVGPVDGLRFHHPLSGSARELDVESIDPEQEVRSLEELLEQLPRDKRDDLETRFLTLWRSLPQALAAAHPDWALLPADTRQPDHTIWHHADTTAAFIAADAGASLLSFWIGPVQQFIAGARTLRDLWMGSFLLAHLATAGILSVVDALGPTALIYPSLRGVPAIDAYLRARGVPVENAPPSRTLVAALPNRFLALVPRLHAKELGEAIEAAVRTAWSDVADAVRAHLAPRLCPVAPDWDADWDRQIDHFFDVRTSVLDRYRLQSGATEREDPRAELLGAGFFAAASAVSALREAMPERDRARFGARLEEVDVHGDLVLASHRFEPPAGTWSAELELSARLAASRREIPKVPPTSVSEVLPPKCTMLGDWEQMGPGVLAEADGFWNAAHDRLQKGFGGFRLRRGERLSAVGLVKRFAYPVFFESRLGIDSPETRLPDTASLAARDWLMEAAIDPDEVRRTHGSWNGQWLHAGDAEEDAEEPCPAPLRHRIVEAKAYLGPPPIYYAVLQFDGDHLGSWLRGGHGPTLRQIYHPKMVKYFDGQGAGEALDSRRPLGPARHAALSDALLRFATVVVPSVVENFGGRLVYAGGDDVLALLPVPRALEAASEIRRLYGEDFSACGPLMGELASGSAGLVFAHVRSPLRGALDAVREQEKRAKREGRDRLAIQVRRRSGEHAEVTLRWTVSSGKEECCPPRLMSDMAQVFRAGLSVRWVKALRLRGRGFGAEGPPLGALRAEMHRLLGRAEGGADAKGRARQAADALFGAFAAEHDGAQASGVDADALARILETAAFVARGRDL